MEWSLLQAEEEYVGCPQCGGPVHPGRRLARGRATLLTGILAALAQNAKPGALRRALEVSRAEAEERLQEEPAFVLRGREPGA